MSLVEATGDIHLKSVLIATDFSEASAKALRHALTIARHYGAKFYLVHVVSSLGFTLVGTDAVFAATEAVRRDARQLEDLLIQSGALAGLPHEVIVVQGDVWAELEEVVGRKQVELVVIGTHGRRGLGKLLLGSAAVAVAMRIGQCAIQRKQRNSHAHARDDNLVPHVRTPLLLHFRRLGLSRRFGADG